MDITTSFPIEKHTHSYTFSDRGSKWFSATLSSSYKLLSINLSSGQVVLFPQSELMSD